MKKAIIFLHLNEMILGFQGHGNYLELSAILIKVQTMLNLTVSLDKALKVFNLINFLFVFCGIVAQKLIFQVIPQLQVISW